jgi:hypothetical protein
MPFLIAIASLLLVFSGSAKAGIHKCVAPDGTSMYTDQPCPPNKAENAVDSSVSGAGHQMELADTCNRLNVRKQRCARVHPLLESNFKQYCTNPILNYQMDHQRNQQANRYRSGKEHQSDVVNAIQDQVAEDYHCESVDQDTWSFLKANFGKKISEKDGATIEYSIHAVPAGQHPTVVSPSNSGPHVTTTVVTSVRTVVTN